MINLKVNTYFPYMLVIYSLTCIRAGDLAANIGSTNEKPFTISPNQPTILIISNSPKEFVFSKSKTSRASQGWEAVKNHMWPDEPVQAGYVTFRGVRKLKHSCHAQEFLLTGTGG